VRRPQQPLQGPPAALLAKRNLLQPLRKPPREPAPAIAEVRHDAQPPHRQVAQACQAVDARGPASDGGPPGGRHGAGHQIEALEVGQLQGLGGHGREVEVPVEAVEWARRRGGVRKGAPRRQ
jgi:hypothetical protein